MTVAICGSLTFYRELRRAEEAVIKLGYTAILPKSVSMLEAGEFKKPETVTERLAAERKYDFIGEHFRTIEQSDAVLVINPEKKGIPGYIGGNTFLEMGVAFYLKKPIYVLHPLPDMSYTLELAAMRPVILDGDISRIG